MLFGAISNHNILLVNNLVRAGANFGTFDDRQRFIGLQLSVLNRLDNATIAILNSGADHSSYIDNTIDNNGNTFLHTAVRQGNLEVVNALLENGANPNMPDNSGFTPFAWAIHENKFDIAQALLDHQAVGNANDIKLAKITEDELYCDCDKVRSLLNQGAKLELLSDAALITVLTRASDEDLALMNSILTLRPSIINAPNDGRIIRNTLWNGYFEMAEKLIPHGTKVDANVLSGAVKGAVCYTKNPNPGLNIIEKILEEDVDVNARNSEYKTPLFAMVEQTIEEHEEDFDEDENWSYDEELAKIVLTNVEDIAVLLLKKGAKPDSTMKYVNEQDIPKKFKDGIVRALNNAIKRAKEKTPESAQERA